MTPSLVGVLMKSCAMCAPSPQILQQVPAPEGGWTRLVMFFDEKRTSADGTPVECWQLRAEEVLSPPSKFEVAPRPSRRVGAARDGRRLGNGA
jgi:hypothetical protein